MYGLLSGLWNGLEDFQLVLPGAHAELFCVVDLDVAMGMGPAGCEECVPSSKIPQIRHENLPRVGNFLAHERVA